MMADTDNHSISTSEEYKKHTEKYTKLLKNYIKHTKNSNKIKNDYKKIFFWIIIAIMATLAIAFVVLLCNALGIIKDLSIEEKPIPTESIIGLVTAIISSFITMLVSLFKLPEIIAKYLFNLKEDENMAKIIGHIQTYDIGMYTIEKDLEKEAMRGFYENVNSDQSNSVSETEEPIGNPSDIANETNMLQESN